MTKRNIISLVALPIVLAGAYVIERWMNALREASVRTFTFSPWLLTLETGQGITQIDAFILIADVFSLPDFQQI